MNNNEETILNYPNIFCFHEYGPSCCECAHHLKCSNLELEDINEFCVDGSGWELQETLS